MTSVSWNTQRSLTFQPLTCGWFFQTSYTTLRTWSFPSSLSASVLKTSWNLLIEISSQWIGWGLVKRAADVRQVVYIGQKKIMWLSTALLRQLFPEKILPFWPKIVYKEMISPKSNLHLSGEPTSWSQATFLRLSKAGDTFLLHVLIYTQLKQNLLPFEP